MGTETGNARRSLSERRQQLLDAAVEVMSERGISATTTRAIAQAAGVSQGTFHYCFDSKAALLRALLDRESERALASAWQLDPGGKSLSEALSTAIDAHLACVKADPRQFLVLAELTVISRTDPELLQRMQAEHRHLVERIAQLLSRWRTSQTIDELRPWATVILAGVEGITEAWLTTRDDEASTVAASLFARALSKLDDCPHPS